MSAVLRTLPLLWQVWAAMILGAVCMLAAIVVGVEWPWIVQSTRRGLTALVALWRELFTDAELRADARHVAPIGIRAPRRDADEIVIASRDGHVLFVLPRHLPQTFRVQAAPHDDDALRRRQLLALAESSPVRKTVH